MYDDDLWVELPSSWDLNLRNPEMEPRFRLLEEERLRKERRILLKEKKKKEKRERRKNKNKRKS